VEDPVPTPLVIDCDPGIDLDVATGNALAVHVDLALVLVN